jgi:hypothetical protein
VDTETATTIAEALSDERFATYLHSVDGAGDPLHAMRLYGWNMEASAALWGPLHVLEVVTRNAMHRELSAALQRDDWWHHPALNLTQTGLDQIAAAERYLTLGTRSRSVGATVAELPFGFWVSLLGPGNNYEMTLWRPALRLAFPRYVGLRKPLHKTLNALRGVRNRIAHHEPIFTRDLARDLDDISTVVGYVSTETATWVSGCERVSTILRRRRDVLAGSRPNFF